jgi:PAS domain S-box-containing protein
MNPRAASGAVATTTILIVEDNPGDAFLLRELLTEAHGFTHETASVERLSAAMAALDARRFDVLLLDLTLPDASGLDGLRRIHAAYPDLPIVVLTGLADEALAIQAVQSGAQDYLVKGETPGPLVARSIRYAIERNRAEIEARRLAGEQAAHATERAERARLHALLTQAPVGICLLSGSDFVFELANNHFLQLVGRSDLVGRPVAVAAPELAGAGFEVALAAVRQTGESASGRETHCRFARAGGPPTDAFVDFVYEPMREPDGTIGAVMVVASDVTERVLARERVEEARRQAALSEQRFRLLAEVVPQLIWSMEPGGASGYLSPRWFEYTGQPADEPAPDAWREAIHPDDRARCYTKWAEAEARRSLWQLEYRLRRHDGEYRWHLARSMPHLGADGTILRWYGSATDIDEQKRAVRSRDDLLATVSHDLRGPLGVIAMAVDGLTPPGSPPVKQLTAIDRAVARMTKLIQDLLDMASIESGHLSVDPTPLDVESVVEEAIDSVLPAAAAKQVTVTAELPASPRLVHADRGRVLQVLGNIIGNALKFTRPGGRIAVRARAADHAFLEIAVSDTGPGIAADQLPRVFERFWQAKETARAGTGLGLAICKGIVQQHGGAIWVESRVGEGTTFYFTLPFAEVPTVSVVSETPNHLGR